MKNPATIHAFGVHLRNLRLQKALSQQALADEADLSRPTVQRVEAGHLCATLDVLTSLARGLQMPLRELMDFPGAD